MSTSTEIEVDVSKVLKILENLSSSEQEVLFDILQQRRIQKRRQEIAGNIAEAHQEYKMGKTQQVKKHPKLKERIAEKLTLLSSDPFNPILRTHKLKGDLAGSWSCTIEYDCRVLFDFVKNEETGEEEILLINIRTHDEVY